MNFDLIGCFDGMSMAFGHLDVRHHEAVLPGEFPAHLDDHALPEFARARPAGLAGQLLAEAQLDLRRSGGISLTDSFASSDSAFTVPSRPSVAASSGLAGSRKLSGKGV